MQPVIYKKNPRGKRIEAEKGIIKHLKWEGGKVIIPILSAFSGTGGRKNGGRTEMT